MIRSLVVNSRLAWREARLEAARQRASGLKIFTIPQLTARLAGGFLELASHETLQETVAQALAEGGFREIGDIAALPGMVRASVATLRRAWEAGVDLHGRAGESERVADLALIEARVRKALPARMLLPPDLVRHALPRIAMAARIVGPTDFRGISHLAPEWRPVVCRLAGEVPVRWQAPAGDDLQWLRDTGAELIAPATREPVLSAVSCANPRHEALEALRWARELVASGRAAPGEIAIVAAATDDWDDHIHAIAASSELLLHFVHGRRAVWSADGQRCAALAQVLLHGISHQRVHRLVRTLKDRLQELPGGWARVIPANAPLLSPDHWRRVLNAVEPDKWPDGTDYRATLLPVLELLQRGTPIAAEAGETLLTGRALALWRQSLRDGPPEALDVSLSHQRLGDDQEPAVNIIWGPASELVAAPRKHLRLLGLSSRSWPRHESDDPLLPDHLIPRRELMPVSVPARDRHAFRAICTSTAQSVVISRSRRDAEGRVLGQSPLVPSDLEVSPRERSRVPEHAVSEADRLLARPDEFASAPIAVSASTCWHNWRRAAITAHDGLVREDHPVVLRALARVHSASSLKVLLRDPLAFLWRYALRWQEPEEAEEPLTLDARTFGTLAHRMLEHAVTRLEADGPGLAAASGEQVEQAAQIATRFMMESWPLSNPVPPALIWQSKLAQAQALAVKALKADDQGLEDQRSWVELPFGERRNGKGSVVEPPWELGAPVRLPGVEMSIAGDIDRLDLSANNRIARITDYKTGKPPRRNGELTLKGGEELQRCLYAFAVRTLLPDVETIHARLLYPRAEDDGVFPLDDDEATLVILGRYLEAAKGHMSAGRCVPGIDAGSQYNDFAFALPSNAEAGYFRRKQAAATELLAPLDELWELP